MCYNKARIKKNHCDAESFYNFLKKDSGIIEQNIVSILNDFIHFKNVIVNLDVLENLIQLFPIAKEIFNSKKNFEELVQKNVHNTHKLLKIMKKSNINLSIENGIYLIHYIQKNNIDFHVIND